MLENALSKLSWQKHELLLQAPRKFLDYTSPALGRDIRRMGDGEYMIEGVVTTPLVQHQNGRLAFGFQIETSDSKRIHATLWGPPRGVWRDVYPGFSAAFYGKVRVRGQNIYMTPDVVPQEWIGRVRPVYKAIPGRVSSDTMGQLVRNVLHDEHIMQRAIEHLREATGISMSNSSWRALFMALHAPRSMQDAEKGVQLARMLSVGAILRSHAAQRVPHPQSRIDIDPAVVEALIRRLPFTPSPSQYDAIMEVVAGLRDEVPLRHLISGDVGSGKTVTYLLPAVAAHQAGARVVIMMPNALLAEQVYRDLCDWWGEIPAHLVTSEQGKAIQDQGILVGTTALLHRMKGWQPDVLILDEQQKLSRQQRERLAAPHTNIIEATATCIPRTAALVSMRAMSVSCIEPHVVKTIHTKMVDARDKEEVFRKLKTIVQQGGRIACVYPLRDGEDERKTVVGAQSLWEKVFPGRVALLHGGMDEQAKAEALDAVRDGRCPVLVTTTVIEVGINIPDLRAMLVVHAERYGVSTLHQLRGRIARHGGEGWFWMYLPDRPANLDDLPPEEAEKWQEIQERLMLLEMETNGHRLAELDAARRGFGDLDAQSDRQHGKSLSLFKGLILRPEDFELSVGQRHAVKLG